MEFRVLGDLEVSHGGRVVPLGPHQQRAVLAILVLHAGEVVSADRLIDELWGDRPPATGAKTVHVYVSRLRKALVAAGDGEATEAPILTRDHGYVLGVDPDQVDMRVFERLLDQGRRASAERAYDRAGVVLDEALALWRGPALAEFAFDGFADVEIARLEELRLEALELRVDADLAVGRHAEQIAELELLCARHPLRERLHGQRMLALYRCGRQSDALQVYRDTRKQLIEELGIEPGEPLRELHEAILRQSPSLRAPSSAAGEPATSDPRRRRVRARIAGVAGVAVVAVVVAALLLLHGGTPAPVTPNSVAVIDPGRNSVVGKLAVGSHPDAISAGAGGVWVANVGDRSLSQVDPRSATVTHTFFTRGTDVDALAAGRDAVWTTDARRATATRINPEFRQAVRKVHLGPRSGVPGGIPSPIAVGNGSVWAVTGSATVARIDPVSGDVEHTINVGDEPAGIAVGADGVWVADDADNTVWHIDRAGVVTDDIPVGDGASGIAVGAGGVWVANTLDNTVTRIDPATRATRSTINVGPGPRGVAVGLGSVWVADSRGGSVSRIDPRTDRVQTIPVGGSPVGVAIAAGRAWVTVQAEAPRTPPPARTDTLRIVQEHDFGATDPALLLSYGPEASQLAYATCAKLLNYRDRQGRRGTQLVPEVATALPTISRDQRTYTFTVRPGFRFSPPSNAPVTGRAFERAIERVLSPQMRAGPTGVPFLREILGVGDYAAGRTTHLHGLTATRRTVTIRMVRPVPSLPAQIAMPLFCAVPPETPIRSGGVELVPSAGPYYIATHEPNSELVLRRNPNYRGPRRGRFDVIDYTFGITPLYGTKLVRTGYADYADAALGDPSLVNQVSPARAARLQRAYGPHSPAARAGGQRYFVNPLLGTNYLLLNAHRPLFASARMRKAVNFAVDRPALARTPGPSLTGVPTDQYLPTPMPGFRDAHVYPLGGPDVARARSLAGDRTARAVMYTPRTPASRTVAEIVKADLRPLGIVVQIKQFPWAVFLKRESAPRAPYDIGWSGWLAIYADPSQFIDPSVPGFALDVPGATARHYRKRMAADAELSGARRLRAYGRLDVDLATHVAPVVAFGVGTVHDFFAARIGCQTFQPLYGIDLTSLCLRRAPAQAP